MDRINEVLGELQKINKAHSLENPSLDTLCADIKTAKVCTPIIGKFSSGKSALMNTLLGYGKKLLKEDITPETAVPAEISYSEEDSIFVVGNDGTCKQIDAEEYRQLAVDANTVRCTRLNLRNSFLERIPDVMLVDMPGFESGFEVHNRAIDNYLPRSLAYIIAVPADDMIIRNSVGDILKELCLHDMPICIAITKYDKCNDEFDNTLAKMKESLKKFIGNREFECCNTSSFTGDAEDLETFLEKIQSQSQVILFNKFKAPTYTVAETTEKYLSTILKNNEMSESELTEQEEKIAQERESLTSKLEKERASFDEQIVGCVDEIKGDVQIALEAEEDTFVAMAMNKQDIKDRVNVIVRSAVTSSIQKRFVPKVEKYLKRVKGCINGDSIGNLSICCNLNPEEASRGIGAPILAGVAAWIVFGPIVGGLVAIATKLFGSNKREEIKNQIRTKLHSEVYPQILQQVGSGIERAITEQIKLVNTSIDEDIASQHAALEQALEKLCQKIEDEKTRKTNLVEAVNADLEKIRLLKMKLD